VWWCLVRKAPVRCEHLMTRGLAYQSLGASGPTEAACSMTAEMARLGRATLTRCSSEVSSSRRAAEIVALAATDDRSRARRRRSQQHANGGRAPHPCAGPAPGLGRTPRTSDRLPRGLTPRTGRPPRSSRAPLFASAAWAAGPAQRDSARPVPGASPKGPPQLHVDCLEAFRRTARDRLARVGTDEGRRLRRRWPSRSSC
jgi:hypothetical protein